MKVIIDVTRLMRRTAKRQTITGIDRVTMAFVSHYAEKAQALVRWGGRSWVLPQAQSQALFKWLDSRGSKVQLARYILSGILLRRKINEKTVLLNTGHVGLGQSDYQRIIKKQGAKSVFIVHDTIPVTYPEYCSPGEDQRYHEKMSSILSLASAIITNSQATLNDLSSYLDQKIMHSLLARSFCWVLVFLQQ